LYQRSTVERFNSIYFYSSRTSEAIFTCIQLYRSGISLFETEKHVSQQTTYYDEKNRFHKKPTIVEFVRLSFSLKPDDNLLKFQSNGISPFVKTSFVGTVFSTVLKTINELQKKLKKYRFPFTLNSLEKIFVNEDVENCFNFSEMINHNFGHFHFSVSPAFAKEPFPEFDIDPTKGYVGAMVYIPSESIQIDNKIKFECIILDATFNLIPGFTVSLVSGIIFNSYIPLGFTIDHSENTELYQQFYSTFFNQTQFNLSQFQVLYDRHTRISSFFQKTTFNNTFVLSIFFDHLAEGTISCVQLKSFYI
jgi:hypothetical protein